MQIRLGFLAASLALASAFNMPASFLPKSQLHSGRSSLRLRMTATEPAAAPQIGKRAEHFSASFAHPQPVEISKLLPTTNLISLHDFKIFVHKFAPSIFIFLVHTAGSRGC
jgi:hypothetical protein